MGRENGEIKEEESFWEGAKQNKGEHQSAVFAFVWEASSKQIQGESEKWNGSLKDLWPCEPGVMETAASF